MVNRRRGDVPLHVGDRRLALRLTLGGLAELEDALAAGDLIGLSERLASGRLATRDLIAVLRIGLKGAGHRLDDAEIEAMTLEGGLEPIVSAVAALFASAFGAAGDPTPQAASPQGEVLPGAIPPRPSSPQPPGR
jgi:hypothetical protein